MIKPNISVKKLNMSSWLIVAVCIVICITLGIHAYYPFAAERNFREGFNSLAQKRTPLAIFYLKKARDYAPWETHYQLHLGRAYEQAFAETKNTLEKHNYLELAEETYLNMINLDSKNPWYKNRLANIYAQKITLISENETELDATKNINYYSKLIENYTRNAAKNDNQNPLFQLNLAYYLHQTNQIDLYLLYHIY